MHDNPFSGDRLQNHEVGHVPVKNGREPELAQVLQFVPERPSEKMDVARDLDESAKRDAVERGRITAPQGIQVNAMAVVGRDHGQAGEAAFRRLRLPNARQIAPSRKIKKAHPAYKRTPRSGFVSQLISERFSRMTSALRSMSGCRATRLP